MKTIIKKQSTFWFLHSTELRLLRFGYQIVHNEGIQIPIPFLIENSEIVFLKPKQVLALSSTHN
jgi:hypothetical protein